MKILFSVYKEDHETEEREFLFSKTVVTDIGIEGIDSRLELYEGFHSVLEVGRNLVFWDIYSFFVDEQELVRKINDIPIVEVEEKQAKEPKFLMLEEFDPGNADDASYPDVSRCFMYRIERYECGASSFGALIAWLGGNPFFMDLLGSFTWDMIKFFALSIGSWFRVLFGCKAKGKAERSNKRLCYLNFKRFYRDFSKASNVAKKDCQIVNVKPVKSGKYKVRIRTIFNEIYDVKCNWNGKIISLDIDDKE